MAMTIPQYKPQTRREPIPAARHQVSADANAFGAGVYGAQGQLADLLYQRGLKMQEEQDDAAVMGAAADYLRELNTRTYGEGGFLSTKGKDAIGGTDNVSVTNRAVKDMDELQNQFTGALKNHRQQKAFSRIAFQYNNNVLNTVSRHQASEHQVYIKGNYDSLISQTISAAALATDDDSFNATMGPAILGIQKMYGPYGEAVVQAETKKLYSSTHLLRAQNIGMDDPAAAADYLQKHEGDIASEDMQKLVSLKASFREKVKEDKFQADLHFIKTSPEFRDANGAIDLTKVDAWAYGKFGDKEEEVDVGAESVDESALRFSKGDNPDWSGVTTAMKSGVTRLWPSLTAIDPGAVITSGYRDPERNRRAGGVETSNHLTGNAVDIAFERNLTKGEQKNIEEQARALGFQEVLWHDAGSGYHLHVGDYQGKGGTKTTRTIPADYKKIESAVNYAKAVKKDEEAEEARRERDYKKSIYLQLAQAPDRQSAMNIISNVKNLPLNTINELRNAVNSNFDAQEKGTQEQKLWARYELSGFYTDENLLAEYNQKIADGEDITSAQQTRYNNAASRMNRYFDFTTNGDYSRQVAAEQTAKQNETDIWQAIGDMANKGRTKDQIISRIQDVAPQYGFNAEYFINNSDWSKLGKVEGGVK